MRTASKFLLWTALVGGAGALLWPAPARGVAKEIIQLQRDVALLQEQVRDLQRSLDEKNAVLKTLIEQAVDSVNQMQGVVSRLENSVQKAQAGTNTRVEALGTQVQSMRDTVDELRARMGQLSQQLTETRSVLESVDARLAAPPASERSEGGESGPSPTPTATAPPSAETLYSTALRDFINGNYALARQEFSEYLSYYGRTQRAGNAQYYIGETHYRQGDFRQAIEAYDKVLDNFPNSFKTAAAHLKKGYALLELDERQAGVRALQTVLEKFPRSDEAKLARSRLDRLGETVRP
ncbi:MAG: tol-pal system protein YbgF [Terriglobia bacterium]